MKTIAFVPIKLNSERLPLKNIRPFTNGKPLIYYILHTLMCVAEINEIYVYCSSDEIVKYLPDGIKFLKREPYFDLSTTKFNEVLVSFAKLIDADTYLLTHATAPFISEKSMRVGIEKVNSGNYDSAFSVCEIQEFLWLEGTPFNYELTNIPRTQELKKMYIETCGLYVYKKNLILDQKRRIGDKPYLIQVSKIEACDINTEDDFYLADAIYNYKREKGEIIE